MAVAVEAAGLCKSFRAPGGALVRAVDQVSLRLETGQVLGLLGPAGAGKTTLLRLIGGTVAPARGRLQVHARPLLLDEPPAAVQIPAGATAVVATSDLAVALSLCHVIALMDQGRLLPARGAREVRDLCGDGRCHIRIQGHLPERWAPYFDGMAMHRLPGGETLLEGAGLDQAALHGVLARLRDLGLPLLAMTPVPPTFPELVARWQR